MSEFAKIKGFLDLVHVAVDKGSTSVEKVQKIMTITEGSLKDNLMQIEGLLVIV